MREQCDHRGGCDDTCARVAASARRTDAAYEEAFAEAVRGFALGDPHYCRRKRTGGTALGSGSLEREYRNRGHRVDRGGVCRLDPDAKTDVTEIGLERTACYGSCPTYTVRFHSDGSVDYLGSAYVERTGPRHGKIPYAWFRGLAELAVDIGYFDLDDGYSCLVSDMPTVYLSITRAGKRR